MTLQSAGEAAIALMNLSSIEPLLEALNTSIAELNYTQPYAQPVLCLNSCRVL